MGNDEKMYTVQEFATLMKLSRGWIYELVKTGKIPAYRCGRSVRIPHSAIDALRVTPRGAEK